MGEEEIPEFIGDGDCDSWFGYLVDGLVMLKAALLMLFCLCAIRWYTKSEMKQSLTVVAALVASCALVAFEFFFRYSKKRVLHRFLLNAFSQWLVLWCLHIMLSFIRYNDAARFKFRIRSFIFIPLHLLYAASILTGIFWEEMVICDMESDRVYPRIFYFQYGLFYFTYVVFLVLYCKGYYLEWHEDIKYLSDEQ